MLTNSVSKTDKQWKYKEVKNKLNKENQFVKQIANILYDIIYVMATHKHISLGWSTLLLFFFIKFHHKSP